MFFAYLHEWQDDENGSIHGSNPLLMAYTDQISNTLNLKFRLPRPGPESDLVNAMLKNIDTLISRGKEHLVLIETYAEMGIPDVLVIEYDSSKITSNYCENRKALAKDHLKVLHHIWTSGRPGKTTSEISTELGYSEKQVLNVCETLRLADLLSYSGDKFAIQNRKDNFFIQRIISIEAKMGNVRKVVEQALINLNFASHSYVLLPHDKITSFTKCRIPDQLGLLGQKDDKTIRSKAARKFGIPSSYFSWMINEYVGQKVYNAHA